MIVSAPEGRVMKPQVQRGGSSLLELLAVVVILGILASIVIGRILVTAKTTKENACARNIAEINRALERYYFDNGVWAGDLTTIASSPEFPDGIPTCPVSGAAYIVDGATHRISGHASGSH